MRPPTETEKPLGVYLVSLYFVLAGFLESIEKFRQWGSPFVLNPFSEHSVWHLAAHILIYLALAYLVWQLTWFGRLAGLVYGYLTLGTYFGAFYIYARGTPASLPPLFFVLAGFHVMALIPLLFYLQPSRRKKLFQVSLLEILLPDD